MPDDPQSDPPPGLIAGNPLSPDDAAVVRAHVEKLVNEHGLTWEEVDGWWLGAQGDLSTREIEAPLLDNDIAYWVTLHEIGHHVLGLPTFDIDDRVIFENEERVWEWALSEGRMALTDEAAQAVQASLLSHEGQAPPDDLWRRVAERLRAACADRPRGHGEG